MAELNPKLKKEIDDILDLPSAKQQRKVKRMSEAIMGQHVALVKENFEEMATRYADNLRAMPICFWVKLFEIAEEITNPVLHNQSCTQYLFEKDTCKAGHPMIECRRSCRDYVGEKPDYSKYLECNGECKEHPTKPIDDEGGPHA